MSSGALFPSLVSGSRGSSSKYLVEFRAGKMTLKGKTVTADKRKGTVYVQQTDDSLIHFCWKDRTSGNVDDDLIIFPDDCEFKKVTQCTTGRVFVLKFKSESKRLFFWMQEPKSDKDDEYCRKVNEYLNNPPIPGAPGSGGHELSSLGGEGGLQNLLGNMSHNQLMQLIGTSGLGGLGALAGPGLANLLGGGGPTASSSSSSSRSQSAAATPSSGSAPRLSTSQAAPTTPVTPAASAASPASVAPSTPAPAQPPLVPASVGSPASHQAIQLSDLQSILATMNVPAAAAATSGSAVDLASVCTPDVMAPILANAEVQRRLLPFLPTGDSLAQSSEEIHNTISSPQFQQSMSLFSSALASGQLGPLMSQFGLPPDAVDAANKGDVEAFARAMQTSKGESKDEEEDMSLD
ncbi:proteasomal ubiquitin receptor ADRM1 [Nerophis lumbriciformis]|uniref:proteasomal ubiquitin receptor ADRM1 n=1 Tax=Nerophis lumbriciformis TaxID=546530 RepID=UPI002ADFB20B|nr:proteasomal ubiquitin receptor ADRM1-like [Nerophis lumbriciformis]